MMRRISFTTSRDKKSVSVFFGKDGVVALSVKTLAPRLALTENNPVRNNERSQIFQDHAVHVHPSCPVNLRRRYRLRLIEVFLIKIEKHNCSNIFLFQATCSAHHAY